MSTFKALRIFNEDGKVVSRMVAMTVDELDPGEVVIRTEYSSINYKDALAATGAGKIIRRFPCVGGIDGAGTVESSTDPAFKPGDQVIANSYDIGVAHDGGYAGRMRVPAKWLVRLPQGLSTQEAMALGVAGFTAGLAVVRMEANGLEPGRGPVIVNGATGGVGSVVIDILAGRGYHVVALTGKASEADYLTSLGAKEVMLRSSLDLAKIRPLDKSLWAGAVDNLGGDVLSWMTSTMKEGGAIAAVGLAASFEYKTTVMPFILRGVTLCGIDSVNCPMPLREQVWQRLAGDLKPRHLQSMVRLLPLDQLQGAFQGYLDGAAKGRTVVKIA
ncbi:MAG: oxidoreductase [Rhodocyclaceae bacterium]|nr:oxidoreductase [Rhodocyclaceae bacterium]MCA3135409.1 oxidoreductase [Rhodocyclaceae bacterium]MCA3144448.1 oxidoreductase [Rhodocyclaceae bacterium]